MRKGERPFSATKYGKRKYKPETVARRMLARGYCQVSRNFRHVARVDVSDKELLVRVGAFSSGGIRSVGEWYDYYRRCLSEDVITDVPEPVMFMIRNPGVEYEYRPFSPTPRSTAHTRDEEFVAMMIELGLVGSER